MTVLLLSISLAACDNGSDGSGNSNDPSNKATSNRIDWNSIPSDYHPEVNDVGFHIDGYEKLAVNIFGFDRDVELIYSSDMPADTGFIRLFSVWKKSASFGGTQPRPNGRTLDLYSYGSYACSIQTSNRRITALEGGCYVRLQIFLPKGSEIEVYNVGNLISKRFIAISNEDFLRDIHKATWEKDKFAVIENYLVSYQITKKTPSLTSEELGTVIGEFMRSEDQFQALRRLHSFVGDRNSLLKMIEDKFNYFDQKEARKIVGL